MSIFEIPVHPVAAKFPMVPDDELEALVASISEDGLRHPLVVALADAQLADELGIEEGDDVLVDGRNRRRACQIAGVEPEVEEIPLREAISYIYSENITRRHLSAGQRAMLHAMCYPKGQKRGPKAKGEFPANRQEIDIAERTLARARFVLREDRNLADTVASGATSLNSAYEQTKQAIDAKQKPNALLEELKAKAPDLARLVTEEGFDLQEQYSALKERERVHAANRYAMAKLITEWTELTKGVLAQAEEKAAKYAGEAPLMEEAIHGFSLDSFEDTVKSLKSLDIKPILAMIKAFRG